MTKRLIFGKRSTAVHLLLHIMTQTYGLLPATSKQRLLLTWPNGKTGTCYYELNDEEQKQHDNVLGRIKE